VKYQSELQLQTWVHKCSHPLVITHSCYINFFSSGEQHWENGDSGMALVPPITT
jgi:hypothetical protein